MVKNQKYRVGKEIYVMGNVCEMVLCMVRQFFVLGMFSTGLAFWCSREEKNRILGEIQYQSKFLNPQDFSLAR